jgi:hypothetical protein
VKHILSAIALATLTACGGGGGPISTGAVQVTVECTVANTCSIINNGTITVVAPAASAPAPATSASSPAPAPAPAPAPVQAIPLAVPQVDTNPFLEICTGCLQWSAGGIHYAVVFRDLSGYAQVALVGKCVTKDCTPGPNVWVTDSIFDASVDLELLAITDKSNAGLAAYARDKIFPGLSTWFFNNLGALSNNFDRGPISTLPVPETGDAFARLTAIFNEHVVIGLDQSVTWKP